MLQLNEIFREKNSNNLWEKSHITENRPFKIKKK